MKCPVTDKKDRDMYMGTCILLSCVINSSNSKVSLSMIFVSLLEMFPFAAELEHEAKRRLGELELGARRSKLEQVLGSAAIILIKCF